MLFLRTEVFLCPSVLHSHPKSKTKRALLYKCTDTVTKSSFLTHRDMINSILEAVKRLKDH